MKTAIVAINGQRKDTGESVLILDSKEVGVMLDALEAYASAHKRCKLAAVLRDEFEMLPCKSPRVPKTAKLTNRLDPLD